MMQLIDVTRQEVLSGFDALADIYGAVPPLIMWRAWEFAIYRHLTLEEPVLDIGCGDGRFLRRTFPGLRDVVGVDQDAAVVELARTSGVYRVVHQADANLLPLPEASVASAFGNCSLEHMSDLDGVLAEVVRVVRPGGVFVLSVVTDWFVRWRPAASILHDIGAPELGQTVQSGHERFHHLVSAFPRDEWAARLARAGFRPRAWAPVLSGMAGWLCVLLDQYWHVERDGLECGPRLHAYLERTPRHREGLRKMFDGLLEMSADATDAAGLVIVADR
jgi:SAM-dependent methyltransferase